MNKNELEITAPFIFKDLSGSYAIKINIKDHMKELFEKHKEEGFVCCGFDWCTLIIAFIEDNEQLKDLWNMFDYEPSDNEIYILSKDESALNKLFYELKVFCNDLNYIEYIMSQIDYR